MKIWVIDFEEALRNYSPYHESLIKINSEKEKFSNRVEEIKQEMQGIIKTSNSLLLDESTKQQSIERFNKLQEEAIELEQNFRNDIVELQNKELENNFNTLSEIVEEWISNTDVDMILNRNQVIWTSSSYDATEVFLEVLKTKELYKEFNEEEFTSNFENIK